MYLPNLPSKSHEASRYLYFRGAAAALSDYPLSLPPVPPLQHPQNPTHFVTSHRTPRTSRFLLLSPWLGPARTKLRHFSQQTGNSTLGKHVSQPSTNRPVPPLSIQPSIPSYFFLLFLSSQTKTSTTLYRTCCAGLCHPPRTRCSPGIRAARSLLFSPSTYRCLLPLLACLLHSRLRLEQANHPQKNSSPPATKLGR